jgi:hypothetical protein
MTHDIAPRYSISLQQAAAAVFGSALIDGDQQQQGAHPLSRPRKGHPGRKP